MQAFRSVLFATTVLFTCSCTNAYKTFYKQAPGATPEAITMTRVSPPTGSPIVERSKPADPQTVIDAYMKRGYAIIGSSFFNSGQPEPENAAIKQARLVGADLVLIFNPQYTGSVTSSIPITTPKTSTSYTTGTATAYSPGGTVTAYGSGTTTTTTTQTTYVPITTHRSDYGAVYFVKRRFGLGADFRDLNDAERQMLQTNKGVTIRLIVDDSPAFDADLLIGDIITAIDGTSITNSERFAAILGEKRGQLITISIVRHGQHIEKKVQMNP